MRVLSTLLILITVSALFCTEGSAQEVSALGKKAENLVKSRRPDFRLTRKTEGEKESEYNFGSARSGIRILIFYGNSREEAIERMHLTNNRLSVGPGKSRGDLGEEAYWWKNDGSGFTGVRFRKSRVYIELAAPSAIAEGLAKSLASEIKK